MRSSDTAPDVDFVRDVPTTAEDVAALERLRDMPPLPSAVYFAWLEQLTSGRRPEPRLAYLSEPFTL
jgi:hypothetical protein